MLHPTTPTRKTDPPQASEALSPNGDNLANLCPDLASLMDDYRTKINAARVWPVVGTYDNTPRPFKSFPRLPSEIRGRVWEIAARQPRVLEVICHDKPLCNTPVPAVFHASSESRKYALGIYEKLILENVDTGAYVNYEIDTIFTNWGRSSYNRPLEFGVLHEKCKRLAVPYNPFANNNRPQLHDTYKSVEVFIVVADVEPGPGNIEFVATRKDDDHLRSPRAQLIELWKTKRIKSYNIRDAVRGREKMMVTADEKAFSAMRRARERNTIEPLRTDEDIAIRLQYDLDHGLA